MLDVGHGRNFRTQHPPRKRGALCVLRGSRITADMQVRHIVAAPLRLYGMLFHGAKLDLDLDAGFQCLFVLAYNDVTEADLATNERSQTYEPLDLEQGRN